jgi:hypothetical protein
MAVSHETQTPVEHPAAEANPFPPEALRTPAEISHAFDVARNAMLGMTSESEFKQALAVEPAVDPKTEQHTALYWAEFNNYSGSRVHALGKYGLYDGTKFNRVDPLYLDAMNIIGQTPLFMHSELALHDNRNGRKGSMDSDSALQNTSCMRDTLREFARTYPQANADVIHANMLVMATKAVPQADRAHATNIMKQTIRRAQAALGYEQILKAAGRQYRLPRLSESEDGVDYVVDNNTKHPLYLQVEPSASKFEVNVPFEVTSAQHATVFSMTRDQEFRNTFFIPEADAAQKATRLHAVLDDVRIAA